MKKILILLSTLIVGLSSAFSIVPKDYSESNVKFCFDVSEAFGFSTFPDTPKDYGFNEEYNWNDVLDKDIFLKNNISLKLMLVGKADETLKILPYLGLDIMNIIPAFNLGVDFEIKEKHNFGVGMLIGASEWESKFNNKKHWICENYDEADTKASFESFCLRFLISYGYFIYKGFYIGTNVGFDMLSDIKCKLYIKNFDGYCYHQKTFDGTDFIFQVKVGYRFNE